MCLKKMYFVGIAIGILLVLVASLVLYITHINYLMININRNQNLSTYRCDTIIGAIIIIICSIPGDILINRYDDTNLKNLLFSIVLSMSYSIIQCVMISSEKTRMLSYYCGYGEIIKCNLWLLSFLYVDCCLPNSTIIDLKQTLFFTGVNAVLYHISLTVCRRWYLVKKNNAMPNDIMLNDNINNDNINNDNYNDIILNDNIVNNNINNDNNINNNINNDNNNNSDVLSQQNLINLPNEIIIDGLKYIIEPKCIICMERNVTHIFECGHKTMCNICCIQIKKCPICRHDGKQIKLINT